MAFACNICMIRKGLRGSEIDKLPQTEEEFCEHLERVHHFIVLREGETAEQAEARCLRAYPEMLTCPECIEAIGRWQTEDKSWQS